MPALYALGQHEALVEARGQLQEGKLLAAFLDDTYVISSPSRARDVFDTVATCLCVQSMICSSVEASDPQLLRVEQLQHPAAQSMVEANVALRKACRLLIYSALEIADSAL